MSKTIGISIKESLLEELDQQRRSLSMELGKDITRSAHIRHLLRKALEKQKGDLS